MSEKLKSRLISIIIILTVFFMLTIYYAIKLKEKYSITIENEYTESFSNLVNYVNNVENYLAKAMVSRSSEYSAETLTQIWRDSNLAMVYLARIPLKNDEIDQTAKFLNQVSDYSFTLSKKNIEGKELSEEDFDNLDQLYKYCLELERTLNQLSEEIYDGEVTWSELTTDLSTKFAQSVDSITVFSSIDDNLNEYEGLIYDGAYSDHIEKADKTGLTGEDISKENAVKKLEEFFKIENVKNISFNATLENANIPSYDFVVETDKGNYNVMISKKGGHIVETSLDREVKEEKISQEFANEIGKAYLADKGFPNMKETYFIKQGNIVTINYAYNDNGIVVYPDLIKVRVALDNGEIMGIETDGYLNSHKEREYVEPKISIDDARDNLNPRLEILSENMAIIPTEWKTEINCYEFKGKVEDKEFLVYVNVETGKEEDILVILETPGGTLTV